MKRFLPLLALLCGSTLAGSASAAGNNASTPDFSGVWARQAFGFEQPASGQGPVLNLEHRPNGIGSNANKLVGDYNTPFLKPESAERVRRLGEISRSGNAYPDPSNQCLPQPPPYVMSGQRHVKFLQTKNEIVVIYEQDQQVRHIYLNQQHPRALKPSWYGHSVGRFEGDTLVIDTIGFKVGPRSMADEFGTPFSEKLHLVERVRLVDYDVAKEATERAIRTVGYAAAGPINEGVMFDKDYMGQGLQVQFTADDPVAYTQPWSAQVTYRRSGSIWNEYACAESSFEYYANRNTAIPAADKPDF